MGREAYMARSKALEQRVHERKEAWSEAVRTDASSLDIPPVAGLKDRWDKLPRREQHRILGKAIQAVIVYANPPQPKLVAEARKLHELGVGPRKIAEAFGRRELVVKGWLRNPSATGAEVTGATDDRVKIRWWDEPVLELPGPGKHGWERRGPFPFAVLEGLERPEAKPVPDWSLEQLRRCRRDDTLDATFAVLDRDSWLTTEEVAAATGFALQHAHLLLHELRRLDRVESVGGSSKADPYYWRPRSGESPPAPTPLRTRRDEVFEVLERNGKWLTAAEIRAMLNGRLRLPHVHRQLRVLYEQGRVDCVGEGRRADPYLWRARTGRPAPRLPARRSRGEEALDKVFEVLDSNGRKPLTTTEAHAALDKHGIKLSRAYVHRLLGELRDQNRVERVDGSRKTAAVRWRTL